MRIAKWIVNKDADRLEPKWLTARINYATVKFIYSIKDGASRLKGVRIDEEIAEIGDTICFDGKRLFVERR